MRISTQLEYSKGPWIAVAVWVAAFIVYAASSYAIGRHVSPPDAYFNYLADAFLQGRTYVLNTPSVGDLTPCDGQWCVPFPPLAALLMLPLVATMGLEQVNTVIFGNVMAAANVALVYLIMHALQQRRWVMWRNSDTAWIVALFGLGSVQWYMSTMGSVWFVAQTCTATAMLSAIWLALVVESPFACGVALAMAMVGRPHVMFGCPIVFAIGIQRLREQYPGIHAREIAQWCFKVTVPIAIVLVPLLTYNIVRFHKPFEFGYADENVAPEILSDLHTYGQFSLHYLAHNIWSMLLAGPVWDQDNLRFIPNGEMSILLTMPAVFFICNARIEALWVKGALLSVMLLLVPLLTYYNTGWYQFGYRFSLDYMPALMLLLASGINHSRRIPVRILILLSILANGWGTLWFMNPVYPSLLIFQ